MIQSDDLGRRSTTRTVFQSSGPFQHDPGWQASVWTKSRRVPQATASQTARMVTAETMGLRIIKPRVTVAAGQIAPAPVTS
jgi:hypothetical protein